MKMYLTTPTINYVHSYCLPQQLVTLMLLNFFSRVTVVMMVQAGDPWMTVVQYPLAEVQWREVPCPLGIHGLMMLGGTPET